MNFHKPKTRRVACRGNWDLLADLHFANSPSLRAKPAAIADVIGQDVALDLRSLTVCQQGFQVRARVDRRHDVLLGNAPDVAMRLQNKPVTSMRTQSHLIRRLPDRGEKIATKNFHWDATGELRQVDPGRLRKTRKVDYHDDGFVFQTAKKYEDLGIVRINKLECATRECLEVFSHGNDTPHPPQ